MKKILKFILLLAIIGVSVIFYMFKIEPLRLVTIYSEISLSSNPQNSVNIVIFSDTHYREGFFELDNVVEKINDQNPQLVIFVGDLIDDYKNDPVDKTRIIEAFSKIDASIGKYAIMGNHDYGGYADKVYKEVMIESGFNLLINDSEFIDELNINILGMDDSLFGEPFADIAEHYKSGATNILISHEGDVFEDYADYYEFAISGHSHGGQINLPILRDLVLPIGAEKYIRGYYPDSKVYTTSGIGTTQIHARFLVEPEIVAMTLKY